MDWIDSGHSGANSGSNSGAHSGKSRADRINANAATDDELAKEISDAKEPLNIEWFNDSFVVIPVLMTR